MCPLTDPAVDDKTVTADQPRAIDNDRSKINWARWFLIIGAVAGLSLSLSLPPGVTGDEINHALRVSTIADGHYIPPRTYTRPNSYRLDGCQASFWLHETFPTDYSWIARFRNVSCHRSENARTIFFGGIVRAEVYSPVPYAPDVIGYRIGRAIGGATGSFFGARIAQLICYLIVMAFAIRLLPWGKPFIFAVALLPVLVEGSAGITADTMTMAFSFLAVALTLRLTAHAVRRIAPAHTSELLLLGATYVALGLSKSVYAPMVLMTITIPVAAFGSMRRKAVWVGGTIAATVLTAVAWTFGVVSKLPYAPSGSSARIAASIQHDPWSFLTSIARTWTTPHQLLITVGGVAALVYPHGGKPGIGTALLLVVLIGLLMSRLVDPLPWRRTPVNGPQVQTDRPVQSRRTRRLTIVLALAIAAVSFLLIEYGVALSGFQYTGRYLYGIQGRYFIPLFPLCLYGIDAIRYRPPHRWAVAWIPAASIAIVTWWCVTNVRFYNHWL